MCSTILPGSNSSSEDPLERFYDLLPITTRESLQDVRLEPTPCVHAKNLGKRLKMPWLYLKNETALPTGSVKDRMGRRDYSIPEGVWSAQLLRVLHRQ